MYILGWHITLGQEKNPVTRRIFCYIRYYHCVPGATSFNKYIARQYFSCILYR